MFNINEQKNIQNVLNDNCITLEKCEKHNHNFIFQGATRQEICFSCFGCGAISYLYYDKNYDLFDLVISRCLLNNDYISKKEVERNYISKEVLEDRYVLKSKVLESLSYDNDDVDYLA